MVWRKGKNMLFFVVYIKSSGKCLSLYILETFQGLPRVSVRYIKDFRFVSYKVRGYVFASTYTKSRASLIGMCKSKALHSFLLVKT